MNRGTPTTAAALAALIWLASTPAGAVEPSPRGGVIAGIVSNTSGVPQMGATVLLFNRAERLISRVLTNEKGAFLFDSVLPDIYSIRVHLASFVPAVKNNIAVQPGMRSFLAINLAGVLSSIELVYLAPGQGALMSDDWKWVLRGSLSTRPVLRMLPGWNDTTRERVARAIFGETRGLVKLSAGDGAASSFGMQPDLGTAFALATSLFGSNQIQFSGNVGYGSRLGTPSAGFRTRYSREGDPTGLDSEVNVTMRQVFLPGRAGSAFLGVSPASAPALRTMSATFLDRARITEGIELTYGAALESVQFIERLNYLSPFARLRFDGGDWGAFAFGFSSGMPPAELDQQSAGPDNEMQHDLSTLALFPRVSLRGGSAAIQRAENLEIGYQRVIGSRTFAAGVYRERVSNAALVAAVPAGFLSSADLLPDLFSNASVFNIGAYANLGFTASFTQSLGDDFSITAAAGNSGTLHTGAGETARPVADDVRRMIQRGNQNWLMAKVSGVAPGSGLRFATSYLWTDYGALMLGHRYLTQRFQPEAGLNVYLRQPIPTPGFSGIRGRLEANAELRNLLAEGYLPVTTADGRRIFLIQSPRAVRGGLSFIF